MLNEGAERQLLMAVSAVEQQLISAGELAAAVEQWKTAGFTDLLPILLQVCDNEDGKQTALRSLFGDLCDSVSADIAESIDDNVFNMLKGAMGEIDSDDLQASIDRLRNHQSVILPLRQVSEQERFEIISEHARGGLGEVLLARDRQLNRQVALKRIREKWAEHNYARVRFQLEAEITGRLEHPGVVPVYALGTGSDGEVFYAMRFIRGESLEAAVGDFHKSGGQRSMRTRSAEFRNLMRRFVDVCNTIGYAHSRGIIHRDLKPANIMLGKYGETLVVDWGLAKQLGTAEAIASAAPESLIMAGSGSGSAPTQFGSAVGTPQYMSPEQAAGRLDRMGPSTDVFGLGATLYHLLTNQPPQKEDSVERILDRVEHGDFPVPTEVVSAVPLPLEAICLKAMALRPSDRYSSPSAMGADVERWLADEPVAVCHDSLTVRAVRWVRKHQTLATTSAVAMVLLTIASVMGSLAWTKFEHQQFQMRQAEVQRKAEMHEAEQLRRSRLEASLATTQAIVQQQLADNRFGPAATVLDSAAKTLQGEEEFTADRIAILARADRLRHIAEFYRLAHFAEEANYLTQDEGEIIATVKSLDLLGVWNQADWWNHLPADDLNPVQHDQLKQAVYKQLVLIASTYTKLTGIRTLQGVGGKMPESMAQRLGAIFSKDGKDEARATLRICDMANRFRYAECLRWYRGIAGMRLLKSTLVNSRRLAPPRSSADAYELGILLVTRAIVKDFPFTHYCGVEDDLMNAREVLGVASDLDPDHYWTHLVLAQTGYLLAERAAEQGDPEAWRLYETTRQTFGRCIALQPEAPFAYADLSSVCLREMEVISRSRILSQADIERMKDNLLECCGRYANQAVARSPDSAWVYWHLGHALAAASRIEEAMEAYSQAVQLGLQFSEDTNEHVIDVDEIRGRGRMIADAEKLIREGKDQSVLQAVVAGAYLTVRDYENARPYAEASVEFAEVHPLAWSVRGLIAMEDGDLQLAIGHFQKCRQSDPTSFWATMGMALCHEQLGANADALNLFREANGLARANYHSSDALIGQARTLMRMGQSEEAGQMLAAAREAYAACRLDQVRHLSKQLKDQLVQNEIESLRHISTLDIVNNRRIADTSTVAVPNGDFEIPLGTYWSNTGAIPWKLTGSGESAVTLDTIVRQQGHSSLKVTAAGMAEGAFAETRQTITVEENQVYRLQVWFRSENTKPAALQCFVEDERGNRETVIVAEGGTYDWKEFSATFAAPTSRRFPGLTPMTLGIVCDKDAQIWIDDIRVARQPGAEAE